MSGRQTRPGKMRDNTTLSKQNYPPRTVPASKSPTQPTIPDRSTRLIQNHPPNPGKTDEKQALPVNPEGDSVAGGRFYPRKVVLLWEGGFTQTGKAIMYPGG